MQIHPWAVVDPTAVLGLDVVIGPFCVVEGQAVLGDRCVLESHVVIKQGTEIGPDCRIYEGAVLGGMPQQVRVPNPVGGLTIGERNTIREHVTVHRSMKPGSLTRVGSDVLLMAGVHIAHDCRISDCTIFANNATLGGHVTVDERAFVSGNVAVHQFCRIGRFAMVGGLSRVVKDVPPYVTIDGASGFVVGLNSVGLRRGGFTPPQVVDLKSAYRTIYRSGLRWVQILANLQAEHPSGPAAHFWMFCEQTARGIVQERRMPPGAATLKLPAELMDQPPLRMAG